MGKITTVRELAWKRTYFGQAEIGLRNQRQGLKK